jgi:anti-sigma-K factor RskA
LAEENKQTIDQQMDQARNTIDQLQNTYADVARDMPNSADKSEVLSKVSNDLNRASEQLRKEQQQENSIGYGGYGY